MIRHTLLATCTCALLSVSTFLLSNASLEDCMSERATDLILPYDESRDASTAHSFVLEDGWMVANPLHPDVHKTACIRALHGAIEKRMATSGKRRLGAETRTVSVTSHPHPPP